MNALAFVARDPLRALITAIIDWTSEWFYASIVPALAQRFAQASPATLDK